MHKSTAAFSHKELIYLALFSCSILVFLMKEDYSFNINPSHFFNKN